MRYSAPRGTQDILPAGIAAWQELESTARAAFDRYGYREIRTPIFEQKELFLRSVGEQTDIVQKEMYTFTDRKERAFALRPEGTASVIRAYIENQLWNERPLQKLYYIGPMFRYDRPQKGRYRQFHQIGAEAVGSLNPLVDAEVIALMGDILRDAGVTRLRLHLNSLGDAETRTAYSEVLRAYFGARESDLCADCRNRLSVNPMRVLDCKVESCQALSAGIPPIEDSLNQSSREHYEAVMRWLETLGVEFVKDPRLVRGLDYYTRTAFEYHHEGLGGSVALGGGGRYDRLIADCGGPDTPSIGFSLGQERVLLAASQDRELASEAAAGKKRNLGFYLVYMGEELLEPAVRLARQLRNYVRVEMDPEPRSLKAQFRQADNLNLSHVLILGERELAEGIFQVKNLSSGSQKAFPRERLESDPLAVLREVDAQGAE